MSAAEQTGYDLAAVARRLACHERTVQRMVAAGQFVRPFYIGAGGAPRWRAEDVENWIAGGGVTRTKATAERGGAVVQVRG